MGGGMLHWRFEATWMCFNSLAPRGFFATEQTQKMPGVTACLFQKVSGDAQVFRRIEGRIIPPKRNPKVLVRKGGCHSEGL
jgi:hypothetical protein